MDLEERRQLTELEEALDGAVQSDQHEASSTSQRRLTQREDALQDDRVDVLGLFKVEDDGRRSCRERESVEQTLSIHEVELALEMDDEEVGAGRLLIRNRILVPHSPAGKQISDGKLVSGRITCSAVGLTARPSCTPAQTRSVVAQKRSQRRRVYAAE